MRSRAHACPARYAAQPAAPAEPAWGGTRPLPWLALLLFDPSAPAPLRPSPPLQANTYQPYAGQTGCTNCPAGSSTVDTGNVECQPCPMGYYSPTAATSCIAAPKGTYVPNPGSTKYTPW